MSDQSILGAVIIDVREPKEFNDHHLEGALNFPSTTFDLNHYKPFQEHVICLVCQSGNRAKSVKEKLDASGFQHVTLLEKQMDRFEKESNASGPSWTVDRQFRMTLGLLLAIFLVGMYFGYAGFLAIPIILCVGLIFTSIIDRCYMRMGIAMLPWNKRK